MRVLPALFVSCAALSAQTFQVDTQTPPAATLFGQIALGDVTGDGFVDLVNVGWVHAVVLPGSATGVFGAPVSLPQPFLGNTVRLVDTNADGQLDIWFCDQNGASRIESGTGGAAVTAFLGLVRAVACADFDEDGHIDLVLGRDDGPAFARNDGTGAFLPFVDLGPTAMAWIRCDAVDLDGDGHQDFVAQTFGTGAGAWRGDGAGNFVSLGMLPSSAGYHYSAIVDVDGDGDPDVLASHSVLNAAVFLNQGNGTFSSPVSLGFVARTLAAADFDGDGIVDLVALSGSNLVLALGTGGGAFATPQSWPVSNPAGLAVGDLDGDGRIDAVTMQDNASLAILHDISPPPIGLTAFGPGMPACGGTIGMSATGAPLIGATDFRITCTNVPPGAHGIVAIGEAAPASIDPMLGLRVHVQAAAPLRTLFGADGGATSFALPIPPLPQLAGVTATLQSFWFADPRVGNTCSPAVFDLASSRGLTLTFQ